MTHRIRSLRPAELPAVHALLRHYGLPTQGLDEHREHVWVATRENGIVGCAALEVHGRSGLLRSVAVVPEETGRGLGRELTQRVRRAALDLDLQRLYLLTETAESFFARLGFRRVSRDRVDPGVRSSREFAELCPDHAAVMVLALTS